VAAMPYAQRRGKWHAASAQLPLLKVLAPSPRFHSYFFSATKGFVPARTVGRSHPNSRAFPKSISVLQKSQLEPVAAVQRELANGRRIYEAAQSGTGGIHLSCLCRDFDLSTSGTAAIHTRTPLSRP
jgi:hypothetical protein